MSRRASCATVRWGTAGAATSAPSSGRSGAKCARRCPPRSPAATATSNSSSGRIVVERLSIAGIGHRGDGVVDAAEGPLYVSYPLPGETVEVETWPGHPDRRQLVRVDTPSPERIAPVWPHFALRGGAGVPPWDRARQPAGKRQPYCS